MSRLAELQAKIEANKQKRQEYAHNPDKIKAIDAEDEKYWEELRSIEEAEENRRKFELEQAAQHEERISQSVEHLTNSMDNVEIHGLPLRALFKDEDCFQLVSIWFKGVLADNAATFSRQLMAEQAENREKDGIIGALKQEIEARDNEIGQLKLENAQLEQYRQNAAEIIREKDEEIERLNFKVDEQRQELALGVRGQIKVVTNLDGGRELAERIKASLIPVTEIVHVNSNTIRITHPDGTTSEDNWLSKGKYRVIDEEEAARFRAELAEQAAAEVEAESAADDTALVIEPPTFQIAPENESAGMDGVQQTGDAGDNGDQRADGENAGAEQSWHQWADTTIKQLQQRIERIERHANIEGAA